MPTERCICPAQIWNSARATDVHLYRHGKRVEFLTGPSADERTGGTSKSRGPRQSARSGCAMSRPAPQRMDSSAVSMLTRGPSTESTFAIDRGARSARADDIPIVRRAEIPFDECETAHVKKSRPA
jgi:hypothetical protein